MVGVAARARSADADRLPGAIDALESQIEPPRPFGSPFQLRTDEAAQAGNHARQGFRGE